jgi:hypothetical protein
MSDLELRIAFKLSGHVFAPQKFARIISTPLRIVESKGGRRTKPGSREIIGKVPMP